MQRAGTAAEAQAEPLVMAAVLSQIRRLRIPERVVLPMQSPLPLVATVETKTLPSSVAILSLVVLEVAQAPRLT
jgi:hypothetical protein